MAIQLKAICAGVATCVVAAVLVATAKPPLDSYLIEYTVECTVKRTCPIIEWNAQSNAAPVSILPRQIRIRDGGAKIEIIAPQNLPIIDLETYLATRERWHPKIHLFAE
jgi:hypothetical protein